MSDNLFSIIRRRIRSASRPFIETGDGRIVTYADAFALSGRLANALVARGVTPGDRVAVQDEKTPEAIMLYLACLRAGAVYLPLNTAYTTTELEYFLGDAEPRVVVSTPERRRALDAIVNNAGAKKADVCAVETLRNLIDAAAKASDRFTDIARDKDDLAALLYTSGTTGRSKGAMLTHGNLASNAATLKEVWHFSKSDVMLHALPIFHTHGLFVATNVVLMAGALMIFLPKFDPDEIFRLLPRATVMMGCPTSTLGCSTTLGSTRRRRRICGCGWRGRRRCSPKRTRHGGRARATPFSSVTA